MNTIEQFQFGSHEVRMIERDGEPWWVGLDVCRALGMSDPHTSLARLDEDDRHTMPVQDGRGHTQDTTVINEPGLYALIFRSRRPEAVEFKRWVTHEVLPSIRKTGGYGMPPAELGVDLRLVMKMAEAWHREHVVPASASVLANHRWNKPQQGMQAIGRLAIQLELDFGTGTATGEITGGDE